MTIVTRTITNLADAQKLQILQFTPIKKNTIVCQRVKKVCDADRVVRPFLTLFDV